MKIGRLTARIAAVITTNLVAWHKFAASTWSGSNRLPDSSPVGTNTAATFTGRGLSFDGVNDVATVGATGATVKTVVFYANPNTTTQVLMQLQSAGAVRIEISSGTLSATGFTSPTFYVNGAVSSTVAASAWQMIAVTSSTGVSASNLLIGQSNTTYYAGGMSNVRLYTTELTSTQIEQLYQNPETVLPSGASSTDLAVWLELNDQSVPGATVSGATAINSLPSPVTQPALKKQSLRCFFDGGNDYISIPTFTPSGDFSLYFKGIINNADSYIFGGSSTYVRFLDTSISINIAGTNTLFETITLGGSCKNKPISIVINVVNGATKAYLNGNLVFTGTDTYSGLSGNLVYLMRYVVFYGFGVLGEAAIYSTLLTDTEAANLSSGAIGMVSSGISAKAWAAWKNTGTAASDWLDQSGNARNGTPNGSPLPATMTELANSKDIIGMAVTQSASNVLTTNQVDYASIADASSLDITSAITIEAWIKPYTVAVQQTILGKNTAYALNITSAAKLQFQKWTSGASGSTATTASITAGTWTHVAVTYDSTTTKFYINGALSLSTTAISGAIDSTSTAALIAALTTTTNRFAGVIDSLKIYSSALSADSITANYAAESAQFI